MDLKLRRYYVIAFTLIAAIVCSQAYWLYSSYKSNRTQALKEINTALKEYSLTRVEKYFGSMMNADTMEAADLQKLKMVQELVKNLSGMSGSDDEQVTIQIQDSRDTVKKTPPDKTESDRQLADLQKDLDSVFKKNELDFSYEVYLFNSQDSARVGGGAGLPETTVKEALGSDAISLSSTRQYFQVVVKDPAAYIFGRMSWLLLFSGIFVLLSVFVLIVFVKTIARQHRLNEQKNDFVNNMTHELKTPLATCSVSLEAIEKFNVIDDREKTLQYIGVAQKEIRRIQTLVDMILTSSSIENNTLEYHFEKTDLAELYKNVTGHFEWQLTDRQLKLDSLFSSPGLYIKADRLHMANVLSNILDNAIKYNREGGSIVFEAAVKEKMVEITLSNTGKGFSKEFESRVFDKFFRVNTGNVHNVKGYGLGLNYVKNVVVAHKGTVSIKSEPDSLTILKIVLPLYE